MKFNLALIKSSQQAIIRKFDKSSEDIDEIIIDVDSLDNENIHALFYLPATDEISHIMDSEAKFYPFIDGKQQGMTVESFCSMDTKTAHTLFQSIYSKWLLYNNVNTIAEIFPTASYLRDLWNNDRDSFFEELWFILRSNIGTSKLRLIYNDLIDRDGSKGSLGHSTILGSKIPNITPSSNADTQIMKSYENSFISIFEIAEYNPQNGELVILTTIDQSPIMIMANTFTFNKLQKSLVGSLFNGLQSESN